MSKMIRVDFYISKRMALLKHCPFKGGCKTLAHVLDIWIFRYVDIVCFCLVGCTLVLAANMWNSQFTTDMGIPTGLLTKQSKTTIDINFQRPLQLSLAFSQLCLLPGGQPQPATQQTLNVLKTLGANRSKSAFSLTLMYCRNRQVGHWWPFFL